METTKGYLFATSPTDYECVFLIMVKLSYKGLKVYI